MCVFFFFLIVDDDPLSPNFYYCSRLTVIIVIINCYEMKQRAPEPEKHENLILRDENGTGFFMKAGLSFSF